MRVPTARRVLIVDLENRPWAIRDRLMRMAPDSDDRGPSVWCAESLVSDVINSTQEGVDTLRDIVRQTEVDVVVIDPWRLWLGKDENDAEAVVCGLKALSSLRESQPNLTVVIVHHVRKERTETPRNLMKDPRLWADTVSGHHALSSHVDALYGLERQQDEEGEEAIVFGGIARNTEPRTIMLDEDETSLRFEVCQKEAALLAVLTGAQKKIWSAAKKFERFTFGELLAKAGTTNRKAVTATLRSAAAHGLIGRNGKDYEIVMPAT